MIKRLHQTYQFPTKTADFKPRCIEREHSLTLEHRSTRATTTHEYRLVQDKHDKLVAHFTGYQNVDDLFCERNQTQNLLHETLRTSI